MKIRKDRSFKQKIQVLRAGYHVLVGLQRLMLCDFKHLTILMEELSGTKILDTLTSITVREKFDSLLSLESTMCTTPGLTAPDQVSISCACAHVAVMFLENVFDRFAISAINTDCFPSFETPGKSRHNIVTLCGVKYATTMHQACFSLWHSVIATRYVCLGTNSSMNVKEVMAMRSNRVDLAGSLARRMQQWRCKADEIVVTFVDCEAERYTIKTLLDSCAVGAEHRDAETQGDRGSLYTLAHGSVTISSKCNAYNFSSKKEMLWISVFDSKHKMQKNLVDHFASAWTGDNCLVTMKERVGLRVMYIFIFIRMYKLHRKHFFFNSRYSDACLPVCTRYIHTLRSLATFL